jgi:hypothetical protein
MAIVNLPEKNWAELSCAATFQSNDSCADLNVVND